ncbi:MFS transporter [Novosphingobium sp.]|uniref:MFS transporter n=1 Tax=Novosphingobium sp. TaxID=1874826 RepID=UPI002734B90A|nr:MFS transporter [Novosphingobium sp.]MDP3907730.1 MFS transporter [Novosphingobium sp.]
MPRFLLLYALAWAGAAIAYVPFLTILLPVRVAGLAGPADVSWLAYIAFAGALAASAGHIAFGYLSDITGNRRGWIWAGLILSCTLLFAVTRARDLTTLIMLIVGWQLALNMMLAPLAALAGDCVPDRQKGLLGGLMAFAPGLGALSGAAVTIPGLALPDARLALVGGIVACCVIPVLLVRLPARVPDPPSVDDVGPRSLWQGAMPRMWVARLAVQIAEAALFAYLFIWLRSIDPGMSDNQTARVFSLVLILSAPLALLAGPWADRRERPLLPLVLCAGISACGLAGMAFAGTLSAAIGAYAVFGIASSVFLALHSAQTLRVLPRSDRRGRDLGLFNLTNTLPSLIMPWLTLALVPWFGFAGLFVVFAVLALGAGLLLAPLTRRA